jgi:hypothetical protein
VYDPTLVDSSDDGSGGAAGAASPGTPMAATGGKGLPSSAITSASASAAGGAGGDASAGGGGVGGAGQGGGGGTGGSETGSGPGGESGVGGASGAGGAAGSGMAGSAPDGGADASVGGCPTSVVVAGESETAMHGGSDPTDMVYKDPCPQGGPVIGYTGSVDSRSPESVGFLATVCGKLNVTSSGNGCQVTVGPGSTLPTRGQYGDTPFTQMCPTNQVVVGMRGRAGAYMDQVAFVCAPLVVTSGASGYSLSFGSTTVLTAAGGSGGGVFDDACPAGQIARGSNISVFSGVVDRMGLVCGTPSLSGP